MRLGEFIKLLQQAAITVANITGGFLGLVYVGTAASAPAASSNSGKFAIFTDNGWLMRSNGTIWDRVGGGYIAIDTYANIVAGYPAASYSGCRARVTDVGYNGSDWICNGSEWSPVAPITLHTSIDSYARAPSGTISTGSSGNITFGTAANRAYTEGLWVYLPSIATTPAITAGYYWCVMSSTTVGTLSSTKGGAAINFTVGASYTGVTTQLDTPSVTILGGIMGSYRRLHISGEISFTNNGNSKSTYIAWGGTGYAGNSMQSIAATTMGGSIRNKSAALQVTVSNMVGTGGGAGSVSYATVNTASNASLAIRLSSGSTATDWWVVDSWQAVMYPR